ncbi:MAG TPA: cobyrinate a,c-diamide synthase [Trebonia sp.]|nr:cobyrinate a,c-diamide synthase [Trebonia sp.]
MVTIPRVVIAAPGTGHGKTSVTTGLLGAFRNAGLTVSPHKVGPDYIDPGYHGLAAGRPGRNLDPWLVGEDQIVPMFLHGALTPVAADIAIVEGVMGLFDGKAGPAGSDPRDDFASTAHVARLLAAPVVIVVDAGGMAASAAALLHGFVTFDPRVRLGGVIFNKVGTERHAQLLRDAAEAVGVPVLGVIRRNARLALPSRHLGLVPARELGGEAEAAVKALASVVADQVDLAAVLEVARSAGPLHAPSLIQGPPATPQGPAATPQGPAPTPPALPLTPHPSRPAPRVAVAAGPAFTFGYAEHPELLAAAGAEVVTFDPLRDEHLPAGVAGLVIGGGFPEEHAARLSANTRLRDEVAALARAGAPVIAECAGLLYLARSLDGHPMCGVLDADAVMTGRLTLGYRDAVAVTASPLGPAGTRVHGHEFHRTAIQDPGSTDPGSAAPQGAPAGGAGRAWRWQSFGGVVSEGFVRGGVHASYLHTHWNGIPGAAARVTGAAGRYARRPPGQQVGRWRQ